MKDLSEMMKFVSDKITYETIRVSDSQLIQPQSSYGIAAKLINEINELTFDQNKRNNSTEQRHT